MTTISEIKNLIRVGDTDKIEAKLYLLKPLELALLKSEPEFNEKLDRPEFKPLWVNRFNALRIQRDMCFQFRDPAPQSMANFYCGYILYLAAIKAKDTNDTLYQSYLQTSISQFNSFHALQELLNSYILECKNSSKNELDNALSSLSNIKSDIQDKTPRCLLLANIYFYLASFYSKLNHGEEAKFCYHKCWTNLCLAQCLESDSERDIHNAYFGQGIKLSNAFGIDAIDLLKSRCLEIAREALPAPVRINIENDITARFEDGKFSQENTTKRFY